MWVEVGEWRGGESEGGMQGRGSSSAFQHINSSTPAGRRAGRRAGERDREREREPGCTTAETLKKKNMQTHFSGPLKKIIVK